MAEEKRIDRWECPLLNDMVEEGLCWEIDQARRQFLKKEAVPEVKDWAKADRVCPSCEHCA